MMAAMDYEGTRICKVGIFLYSQDDVCLTMQGWIAFGFAISMLTSRIWNVGMRNGIHYARGLS